MENPAPITAWHDRLLDMALAWRAQHPSFNFNLRTGDIEGQNRLSAGYWFTGNDDYLFFGPFRPHDQRNMTRTIGFMAEFDKGMPKKNQIMLTYRSVDDAREQEIYRRIAGALGGFRQVADRKYVRPSADADPASAFARFLSDDLPVIDQVIRESHAESEFFIDDTAFDTMLARVDKVRERRARTVDSRRPLCLLGTAKGIENEIARIRDAITSQGAWASWWSFPVREEFRKELNAPFDLYLNTGSGRITHRMRVEAYQTSTGNHGLVSPWPEITEPDQRGLSRAGDKNSEVFKTWLRVTSLERLPAALTLDDFQPAAGVKREGMLNQSAFGYAYLLVSPPERARSQPSVSNGMPVNRILYGPPGTGKTHALRRYFAQYTDSAASVDQRSWEIALVADHGWRAVVAVALKMLGGTARVSDVAGHPIVRAKADERRRSRNLLNTLWAALQSHAPLESQTVNFAGRREPFLFDKAGGGQWTLLDGWQERDPEASALLEKWTAGPDLEHEPVRRYRVVTFHSSYSYEDFVIGLRPVSDDDGESGDSTRFQLVDGAFKQLCQAARANPAKRYALFIDEINRANIAKVFGELITLIEPDKRAVYDDGGRLVDGMEVLLPGAGDEGFGVPTNLDIYGTMNTADRSIALLDTALRRRFEFEEIAPAYELLERSVDGVHLGQLLSVINQRLEYLIDRDHRIGHAYLIEVHSLAQLRAVFERKIVPLLQEYFFDDWGRVAAVLGDGRGKSRFIEEETLRAGDLFGRTRCEMEQERTRYFVSPVHAWDAHAFQSVYGFDDLARADLGAVDIGGSDAGE